MYATRSILVVDDDRDLREFLTTLLAIVVDGALWLVERGLRPAHLRRTPRSGP